MYTLETLHDNQNNLQNLLYQILLNLVYSLKSHFPMGILALRKDRNSKEVLTYLVKVRICPKKNRHEDILLNAVTQYTN